MVFGLAVDECGRTMNDFGIFIFLDADCGAGSSDGACFFLVDDLDDIVLRYFSQVVVKFWVKIRSNLIL